MRRMSLILLTAGVTLTPIAAALKKVIILPIINIDKDQNFAYLEASITDSLKERLREKFAFEELAEEKWALVAEQNFILRDDFHTKTAAMNLGILANQDIVISGGFKPVNKKLAGGKIKSSIHATAHLLDVKKKKAIATIELDLPADSELFTAVGQVADRMEQETRKVIPSKEEAARTGLKAESEPFFADWSLGLRGGGGVYVSGYAKYFTAQLPALGATLHAAMPKFGKMTTEMGFIFMGHRLKEGNDSAIQSLGASGVTSNYMASLSFGYRIGLTTKLYLEPQVGGGYVMQTTTVTGSGINSTLTNGFPFARGGIVTGYRINQNIDASLSLESLAYIEQGVMTYVPLALAGFHYKF
ncbi:MAG TPA: hypothetical protein PKC74_02460 [Turneriella sp.]|nr:hypothetical protein [Turneriella sp.]HNE20143.1 hypothetical protein [Turneriella sp.]